MKLFLTLMACALAMPVFAKECTLDLTPDWEFVSDAVMGGVSTGTVTFTEIAGRSATRLTGRVSLDNNGGFVQMAFDLRPDGSAIDASCFDGLEFDVFGNDEAYDLRLRTTDLTRPWQSFRTAFMAPAKWTTVRIPFSSLEPNKTDATFDAKDLRRIGILAYGREFDADLAVTGIRFYR